MSAAFDMAEQLATSFAIHKCHGTTDVVKKTMPSSLDGNSLLGIISHTVDYTLDGLADVYGFDKEKAKILWARTSGQEIKEDSLELGKPVEMIALPTEILDLIAAYCDQKTCWSLCLTARDFAAPARRHLYRNVDLSTHNRGLVSNPGRCGRDLVHSDSLQCRNFPPAILQQQETFIRTLDVHPEYKLYVHALRWTILPFDNNLTGWYSQDGIWRFLGSSWQVLGSLTNLRFLDLFDLSQPGPDIASPRREFAPAVRMPHLRILGLGGCIEPKVGAPLLLRQDLAQLTHLYLNNVFMQRPLHDYLDEIVMTHLECCTMITTSSYYYVSEQVQRIIPWEHYARHAPELLSTYEKLIPVNTYLCALLQCHSLKVLTFETHGPASMEEYPGPLPAYLNALGYMLCGMILERNSQTLTHFNFRHGTDNPRSDGRLDSNLVWQPMVERHISWRDYIFGKYIYSSICRNQWPCMKAVLLTAVDSWGVPGLPDTPSELTPIPVPECKALDMFVKEGMLQHRIRRAIGKTGRLACLSQSRLFDPFQMSVVEPTESEEEEDEVEEGQVEVDKGEDDDEGEGEENQDTNTDQDAEEHEDDDKSDSVEEISQAEYERSQKKASV